MDQKKTVRHFSMKDKIGYTLGDLGCCFTEQYRAMYLSIFYTKKFPRRGHKSDALARSTLQNAKKEA